MFVKKDMLSTRIRGRGGKINSIVLASLPLAPNGSQAQILSDIKF